MKNNHTMNDSTLFSRRNAAIDMLRALTMFTMIFVNDFWKIHDVPHWMEHAQWAEDFMGLADVVFPCFLFAVGMSIPYAIERRYAKGLSAESTVGHILSRTLALLVMGAFITNSEARLSPEVPYPIGVYWFIMAIGFLGLWNQYPHPANKRQRYLIGAGKVIGAVALLYLAFTFRSPKGAVFGPQGGILGAIGWTYLVCAMLYFFCRNHLKRLACVWGVFILIMLVGTPLRETYGGEALLNFPDNFYHGMLGLLHVGNGALLTLSTGGMLLSLLSARYADRPLTWKLTRALAAAVVFTGVGALAHHYWIVSKIGATPPWVFFVIALSVALYAWLDALAARGLTGWFALIRPAGTATLTTYLIPYVCYGLADVTGITLPDGLTHGWLGLANCLCFAWIVIAVTGVLERLHIKLKI